MLYCIDLKEFQQYHKQYDYQKYDQEILWVNLNFRKRTEPPGIFLPFVPPPSYFYSSFCDRPCSRGRYFCLFTLCFKKAAWRPSGFCHCFWSYEKATGPRLHQQKLIPTIPLGNWSIRQTVWQKVMTTTKQWNFCPRILPFSPIHGSAKPLLPSSPKRTLW